jgi:DNA-binding MarR family transcriptional regulator
VGDVAENSPTTRSRNAVSGDDAETARDEVVDALLLASRALVAIAARSLAEEGIEVTLPQFRALVVLRSRGPQRVVDISRELGVDPSAGTRLCDRLVRKQLARRQRSTTDRRVVRVALTPTGQSLVEQVTLRRREELARVVREVPGTWPSGVTQALHAFAAVAGVADEEPWWMGWQVDDLGAEDSGDPPVPGARD